MGRLPGLCDASDPACLERAAEILRRGGVVAFPTETVYGLGAVFDDERAVARVFEVKGRPRFDPLIVHVLGTEWVEDLAEDVPAAARRLMERFWPGPLTVVVPKRETVPGVVTAGLSTVAVRAPSLPAARGLLERVGRPVAAPSANRFGAVSPVDAGEVLRQLSGRVDLVLDGGRVPVGVESTIVGFGETGEPVLLRPGGVPREALEEVVGPVAEAPRSDRPESPGRLPRHYAPDKPVVLVKRLEDVPEAERKGNGALGFREREVRGFGKVEFLSAGGDLREAACNLFAALSALGRSDVGVIYAEEVPEKGLGLAVMDRLRRASHPKENP